MKVINKEELAKLVGERIKRARKISGLSLRALAKKVGLSANAISKYERGLMAPSSQVILKISQACGLTPDFFLKPPRKLEFSPIEYRAHTNLPQKKREALFERVRAWLENYLEVEDLLGDFLDYDPFIKEVSSYEEVEKVAEELRKKWGLGVAPIANLVSLLEDKGIKVGLFEMPEKCSAFTFLANGKPIMAGNAIFPGDRLRFSLAHELGHLVLKIKNLDEEKACSRFAGAFLVPKEIAIGELQKAQGLNELIFLKHKYGLSIQGWIYRAKDLGIISEKEFKRLFQALRAKRWHKKEPGPEYPREEPLRFKRLVCRALEKGIISPLRAKELLDLTSLEEIPCK